MARKDDKPGYPGIWMSRTLPLAYRVLPKCGCTSVMQLLHYIDHGVLYDGLDDDRLNAPILKSKEGENDAEIGRRFASEDIFSFTFVRNPYRRVLSAFSDKILGIQPNGRRYAGGKYHRHLAAYGWKPRSAVTDRFKVFLRLAADTIDNRQPVKPDMHWRPCAAHLWHSFRKNPDWRPNFIGRIEHFPRDLDAAMRLAGVAPERVPPRIPRENATSLPDLPIRDFYGPEEVAIMQRVYARDFELFGYGAEPDHPAPETGIDAAAVAGRLAPRHRKASPAPRRRVPA